MEIARISLLCFSDRRTCESSRPGSTRPSSRRLRDRRVKPGDDDLFRLGADSARIALSRHPRGRGGPGAADGAQAWIPAFAGKAVQAGRNLLLARQLCPKVVMALLDWQEVAGSGPAMTGKDFRTWWHSAPGSRGDRFGTILGFLRLRRIRRGGRRPACALRLLGGS